MYVTLALTLIKATGNHIIPKIDSISHKEVYKKTIIRCLKTISDAKDLDLAESLIQDHHDSGHLLYPKRFFIFDTGVAYHYSACNHAIEAIRSIRTRFITGGSKAYNSNQERWIYEDKSIL